MYHARSLLRQANHEFKKTFSYLTLCGRVSVLFPYNVEDWFLDMQQEILYTGHVTESRHEL